MKTLVTGARPLPPEYAIYRGDVRVKAAVDAIHDARCGCENWVFCCLDQPQGFFEETVREVQDTLRQ